MVTKKAAKTGKGLERRVAQAYRAMGACKVDYDVELSGHQIDVYVEMDTPDHGLHRIVVEAKDYTSPVGIRIVEDFSEVVARLRRQQLIDEGVIVSAVGFSRQARNAARDERIRLLTPADLDAMIGRGRVAPQPRPAYTPPPPPDAVTLPEPGPLPYRSHPGQARFNQALVPVSVAPESRVSRWWPLILVALGLTLLAPRILGTEEPDWLSTLSDILGTVSILVAFVLLGIADRQGGEGRLVMLDQVQPRAPDFAFHVVYSTADLMNILLPNPTGEVSIPDREVPYIPRDLPDLRRAFAERGRVLLRGRSQTGKTRAIIELLRRYWRTSPTVLVLKRTSELRVPTSVPGNLPRRNLVILIDDLHTHALACRKWRTSVGASLSEVIDFFVRHCGNQASEVRLIAIVRREPECWAQIECDPTRPPWHEIELVDLPDLSPDDARRLVAELTAMPPPLRLAPDIADEIARTNDGTFYQLILAFRAWRSRPSKQEVTAQDLTALQTDLASAWRHRRSVLFREHPNLRYVYGALDLMQVIPLPAHRDLVAILEQSLRGNPIVRMHGWLVAARTWVRTHAAYHHWFLRMESRIGRQGRRAEVWL